MEKKQKRFALRNDENLHFDEHCRVWIAEYHAEDTYSGAWRRYRIGEFVERADAVKAIITCRGGSR